MARLFNVEVFHRTIAGASSSAPVYHSGEGHYALLGSADVLTAQILVEASPTYPAVVTVTYELSNNTQEETWIVNTGLTQTVTAATAAGMPAQAYLRIVFDDFVLPAYGRFAVSSDVEGVTVRIIVCGRTN